MAVTCIYYDVLHNLEEEGLLDISNVAHLFCCHYVFLPRLEDDLNTFCSGWDNHPLRTENNMSPNQLWELGHRYHPVPVPENTQVKVHIFSTLIPIYNYSFLILLVRCRASRFQTLTGRTVAYLAITIQALLFRTLTVHWQKNKWQLYRALLIQERHPSPLVRTCTLWLFSFVSNSFRIGKLHTVTGKSLCILLNFINFCTIWSWNVIGSSSRTSGQSVCLN